MQGRRELRSRLSRACQVRRQGWNTSACEGVMRGARSVGGACAGGSRHRVSPHRCFTADASNHILMLLQLPVLSQRTKLRLINCFLGRTTRGERRHRWRRPDEKATTETLGGLGTAAACHPLGVWILSAPGRPRVSWGPTCGAPHTGLLRTNANSGVAAQGSTTDPWAIRIQRIYFGAEYARKYAHSLPNGPPHGEYVAGWLK